MTDAVACTTDGATVASVLAWPLIHTGGDAGDVGWDLGRALMQHKCTGAPEAAHKQPEFKDDVVSWSKTRHLSTADPIIRREYEHGKIKARQRVEQRVDKCAAHLEEFIP